MPVDKSQGLQTEGMSQHRGMEVRHPVHFLEAGVNPVALQSHQLAPARKRYNQTELLRNTITGSTVEEELGGGQKARKQFVGN